MTNDSSGQFKARQRQKRIRRPKHAECQLRLLRKFGPNVLGSIRPEPQDEAKEPSAQCQAKFHEMATLMQLAKLRQTPKKEVKDDVWAVPRDRRHGVPQCDVSVKL